MPSATSQSDDSSLSPTGVSNPLGLAGLAALGLYLLSINEHLTVMRGDGYQLAGAVVIAAQVMLVGHYARRHDPLALALVPTLIGHSLVQVAARFARPGLVALVSPGETVGSLAIGAALMHTFPSSRELLGTAVVLSGTLIAVIAGARDEARVPAPDEA